MQHRLIEFLRRHALRIWVGQAIALILIGVIAGLSMRGNPDNQTDAALASSASHDGASGHTHGDPSGGQGRDAPAQIWTCSMHPQIRRNGPGKCPICGMDLVPVKRSTGGIRTISLHPDSVKLMQVETVPVQRRYVTANVRMVGKIDYDETRLAHITAWVSGRLDRLYVDYTGVRVNQGDHMVYLYSEELYTAQQELISALESRTVEPRSRFLEPVNLVESAREKLRLLGLTPQQIQEIETRRTADYHVTIYSPIGGIVVRKLLQEGDRVRTGDRIYTVADLNHLWVRLDAYEQDLPWLRYGQEVRFTTEAYPGEVFVGRIAFIDPILDPSTRTVKIRVNVSNEDGRLKPEMFVRAVVDAKVAAGGRVLDPALAGKWISPMHPEIVKDQPGLCDLCGMPLVRAESLGYVTAQPGEDAKPLVIPVSAALITGKRAIVYVEVPGAKEPTYEGREIVLGPRAGDYYLVRSGLQEGELVVAHGNFKIDSALQISAKPSMMTPEGGGGGGHHHGGHQASQPESDGTASTTPMNMAESMGISPGVQAQMHEVIIALEGVTNALQLQDIDAFRRAMSVLGAAVNAVATGSMPENARMIWEELAMLLQNDAIEAQEVVDLKDATELYQLTQRHIERLVSSFGLHSHQHRPTAIKAPLEFQQQLARLLPPYLTIADALAADDWNRVGQAISQLQAAAGAIRSDTLDDAAKERWEKEKDDIEAIVRQLGQATDIDDARAAFALLSDELLVLQKVFGFGPIATLFELHCPMAFEGRGASWIQTDEDTRNPYFGSSMLKCADEVRPLVSDMADPQSADDPTHSQSGAGVDSGTHSHAGNASGQ